MYLLDSLSKFHAYLTKMEFQPNTMDAYLYEVERFGRFLKEDIEIEFITPSMIDEYIDDLKSINDYSPYTIARIYTALNTFFKFLHFEGYIQKNPMLWIKNKPEAKGNEKPNCLTDEEASQLLKVDFTSFSRTPKRDKAILELLVYTGLKVQELIELKIGDIDFQKNALHVPKVGKGNERIIPLPKSTAEALLQYMQERVSESPWLLLSLADNRISPDRIQRRVKKAGGAVGIHGVTPNLLRRTFEKRLAREGKSIEEIQYFLGLSIIKNCKIQDLFK